jgi:hypothetical protein
MAKRVYQARTLVSLAALCAVVITGLLVPAPLHAQEPPTPSPASSLNVESQGSDTVISLGLPADGLSTAAALQELPNKRYGGYLLPMRYVTVALPAGAAPVLQVEELVAADLAQPPAPAVPELPPALDWQPDPSVAAPAPSLPTAPAFILRSGAIRGQYFAVIAVSPIYQENGIAKIAGSLRVRVPGATMVEGDLLDAALERAELSTASEIPSADLANIPVNAAALTNSFKISVAKPGIQEVLYSQLGLASAPANLLLTRGGKQVSVEKTGDRLRFYAASVGDRWNAASAYWLTLQAGPQMNRRGDVAPGPAAGAFEEGKWSNNRLYETGYPGADGDHWFHADLLALPILPPGSYITQTVPVTVPVQTALPLRNGQSTFAIIATDTTPPSAYCSSPYQYFVQSVNGSNILESQIVSWVAAPNCVKQDSGTATAATAAKFNTLLLRLHPNGLINTKVKLESVTWRRPVNLNFQGVNRGVEFSTDAGAASFALANLPANWQLYEVNDANVPQVVAAGRGGSYSLNQAASAPASRYFLANLGAVQKPAVQAQAARQFGGVKAANALYIGPAAFADELSPLLDLRRQQGFTPIFVDVQAIYDVYGFGQVSAVAIRNFLRHQSDWQNPRRQISVVLAGDATVDPFAYGGLANDTLVAAWMDEVDPYAGGVGNLFGEAACDACIAQLNGDNPLTGDYLDNDRPWFAADVWIGRFPVRNEQEVAEMVRKVVTYDTTSNDTDPWRMRKVFLADNYIKALDAQQNASPDPAGDFAQINDDVIRMLPNPLGVRRIYYDPAPNREFVYDASGALIPIDGSFYQTKPRRLPEGWRISDVNATNTAVIQALSAGASLVAYNGHSNHFYYAKTENLAVPKGDDKWLLSSPDVGLLGNQGKPFVMLAMTCYTSQFVKPTNNGTIDEWLVRHRDGGAVAVWGPTGLSVVSGHELLQDGFLKQLQAKNPGNQRLGNLIEAGYTRVLEGGPLDSLMTFVLLGDPLTRARIPTQGLFMPAIAR